MVFVSAHNLSVHQVFRCVGRLSIDIDALKLFNVGLHDLGPGLAIVQVYTTHTCRFCKLEHLVHEKVPGFDFAVIKHCRIQVLVSLAIGSIADAATTFFIKVVKQ